MNKPATDIHATVFRHDWSGLRNRLDEAISTIEKQATYEMRSAHLDELARVFEDGIARAILAAEKRGEEREREACLQSVLNEQLSGESDDEGDRAYMRAIYDSASAIRARSKP